MSKISLDEFFGKNLSLKDKYVLREYPKIAFAAEYIKKNWKSLVLIIFAHSKVVYKGRASSSLSWSDHLIMIKPDGTLLIHGQEKREPINWQPPGSIISTRIEEGKLVIRSRRYRPKEEVLVYCSEIYVLLALNMRKGEFVIYGSESDMVEYVMKNPDFLEDGFHPIAREYRGRYGIIDLLGRDRNNKLVVCEFKRREADVQDVAQLALYVDSLRKDLGEDVRGILVAPGITDMALIALKEKKLEYRNFDLNLIRREPH